MRGTSIILALVVALLAPPAVARAEAPAPGGTVRLVLPAPTGHRPLGTVSLHLVDRSRVDPWVPAGNGRELMVQVWYPARDHRPGPPAPWVSPAMAARLAPPGSPLELPVTHARAGVPAAAKRLRRMGPAEVIVGPRPLSTRPVPPDYDPRLSIPPPAA